jgi:hypothetical protein
MNLADLRTRVLERLDESTDGLRWTSADVDGYLNLAHQTLCVRTGIVVETAAVTAVANRFRYELPTDCVSVLRLYRDDPDEKVWPTSHRRLDEELANWPALTGTRWEWYFIFGLDELIIGPAFITSGEAYTLTYTRDPGLDHLTADTDEPLVPRKFHGALVDYAVARALLVDADKMRLAQAAEALGQFNQVVRQLRKEAQKAVGRSRTMRPEDPDGADFGVYT